MFRITPRRLMLNIDDPDACRPQEHLRSRWIMLKIDDSSRLRSEFASPVVVTTRVRLLVVLSPPLLGELTGRRLASLGALVVIAAEGAPVPAGHYDVVIRNVTLPAGVSGDLVVELPPPAGTGPAERTAGELVALDRLDDVAQLLSRRLLAS